MWSLGPFELIHRIGKGAMGDVWYATHREADVPVAIKVVTGKKAADEETRSLFAREVRAAARLHHPGIVRIHEQGVVPVGLEAAGLAQGAPFCAMEWLPGGSLKQRAGTSPWPVIRRTLLVLLDALAHAHARGVVHRDLKPGNVLLADRGPVLTDFGIAARIDLAPGPRSGHLMGTPNYMAPEQIRGDWRGLGPWTDLYAVGCLAWCLTTGRPPFAGGGRLVVMKRQLRKPPPTFLPEIEVPDGFEDWLRRLLSKSPLDRFRFAADAAVALQSLDGEPTRPDTLELEIELDWADTGRAPMSLPVTPMRVESPTQRPAPKDWRPTDASAAPLPLPGVGEALMGVRQIDTIGRIDERNRLWRELRSVSQGDGPRLVIVEGPAGFGKTRLARWLSWRAHEFGISETLQATHESNQTPACGLGAMLRRHFRCQGLKPVEMARRIGHDLGSYSDPGMVQGLVATMDWQRAYADADQRLALSTAKERYLAIAQGFKALARRRCLVVLIDSAHWAPDALELIETLFEEPDALPTLFIATVRSGERQAPEVHAALRRLRTHARTTTLTLQPMRTSELRKLVAALVPLDSATVDALARRANGNPLYAEHMVRHWLRSGALERNAVDFHASTDKMDALPTRLGELWKQRLGEVLADSAADRLAYVLAAMLGSAVDDEAWRLVCAEAGVPISAEIFEHMESSGLIRSLGPGEWTFALPQIAEALRVEAQDGPHWEALNAACVDALKDRPNIQPELIAGYLEAADEPDEAAEVYLKAARERLEQGEFSIVAQAVSGLIRVLRQLKISTRAPRWVEARLIWSQCQTGLGHIRAAWRHAAHAVRDARAHGDTARLVEALRVLGMASHLYEGPSAAWSAYWEALRIARKQLRPEQLDGKLAERAGACQLEMGHFDEAERLLRVSLERLEAAESPNQGTAYQLLATVALHRGDTRAAHRLAETALSCHEAAGARIGMLQAQSVLGEIARARGERDSAEAAFRAAYRLAQATGATQLPLLMCNVAVLLVERGQCLEALELVEDASNRARASEYRLAEAVAALCRVYADAQIHRWSYALEAWPVITFISTAGYTAPDIAHLAQAIAERAELADQGITAQRLRGLAVEQLEGLGRKGEARALRQGLHA